ncbi:MAG TPA: NHL repeat-containing protein [Roseiflexaceae bacterium]|nr:NHL repeat-containing protein [Roseiflexaceae bacterium]
MSRPFDRRLGLILGGVLVLICAVRLLAPAGVRALTPPNGAAATLVLGQPSFSQNTPDTTQNRFYAPQDVAVDPVSGNVFVSDTLNNRVLRFGSTTALANGAAAEVVLGQETFADNASACTATGMSNPAGIAVDSAGALWVADSGGNRVLRFHSAATLNNGASASGVLGQPDLTTCDSTASPTASTLANPGDVAVDNAGRLWVADTGGNRVLRFDQAASKVDGAAADGVLGQSTFGTGDGGATQSTFRQPLGIAADASGTLWVSDANNSRVLRFANAAAKANGANADGVLGQSTFTGTSPATGANGMSYPAQIAVEPASGRLWVVDPGSNRLLRFDNAASKANGAAADGVLGQSTFLGAGTGTSATTFTSPFGVGYDAARDVVWVADAGNSRALRFGTPATPTVTPATTPTHTPTGTTTATPTSTSTPTSATTAPPTSTSTPTSATTATVPPAPTGTSTPTAIVPVVRPQIYLPAIRAP